jgi:hypothetical protein
MYRVDTVDNSGAITETQQFDDAGALILYLYAQAECLPYEDHPHKLVVSADRVFTFRRSQASSGDRDSDNET